MSYPQTDVFMVCFSIISKASFNSVKTKWIPELTTHVPDVPIILVGTQSDLREGKMGHMAISRSECKKLAREVNAVKYKETSALTQKGLKAGFDMALCAVLEHGSSLLKLTDETPENSDDDIQCATVPPKSTSTENNNIKIVAVGDDGVGKTSLMMSYTKNDFPENYIPLILDNSNICMMFNGKSVNVGLWDTAGEAWHFQFFVYKPSIDQNIIITVKI